MITWKDFVVNEWKSLLRSPLAGHTIAIRILWSLLLLLLMAYCSAAGYYLPGILKNELSHFSNIDLGSQITLGYLVFDISFRLLFQRVPTAVIINYVPLNISRKNIAAFLYTKSFLNIPNVLGIVFWISCSLSMFGIGVSTALWFLGILSVLAIMNHSVILLMSFHKALYGVLSALITAGILAGVEFFELVSLSQAVKMFFERLINTNGMVIIIPLSILLLLSALVRRNIYNRTYTEQGVLKFAVIQSDSNHTADVSDLRFEWLLVWRNRRLRTVIFMQLFTFGYLIVINGMLMYGNSLSIGKRMLFIGYLNAYFLIFSTSWSQFTFLSESTFFDGLYSMTSNWMMFIRRKFLIALTILSVGFSIILILGTLIFGKIFISIAVSLFILNAGTMPLLVLYRATMHQVRFRIDTSAWFNYEGFSFSIFDLLLFLPSFIIPVIYYLFVAVHLESATFFVFAGIGITNLLFYQRWLTAIHNSFLKRRYAMMEGFRSVV